MKQQQLRCNICIHGVPAQNGENIPQLFSSICSALKVKLAATGVVSSYRTKPSHRSPGLIIVKLNSLDKKLEIVAAKRSHPKLSLANLNLSPANKLIYINNQMTPHMSAVFYKAKSAIINGHCKTAWLGANGIMIRLQDDSTTCVSSADSLDKLIAATIPLESDSSSVADEGIPPTPLSNKPGYAKRSRKRKPSNYPPNGSDNPRLPAHVNKKGKSAPKKNTQQKNDKNNTSSPSSIVLSDT